MENTTYPKGEIRLKTTTNRQKKGITPVAKGSDSSGHSLGKKPVKNWWFRRR